MAIRVMTAASTSAHYHVFINRFGDASYSVSTGLANSRTLNIPVMAQDVRITLNGTFGSGSASTQVVLDISPDNGTTFLPILTVSAPMTTTFPLQADHVIRFRHQWTSAAAAITNASVDAWIG